MDFRDVTNIFITVHAGNFGGLDTGTYTQALFDVLTELFPGAYPHIEVLDRVTGTEPDADVWAMTTDIEAAQRIVRDARQTALNRACAA